MTWLAACVPVVAQKAATTTETNPPAVSWRLGAQWLSTGRWLDPAESRLNPGNRILRLPQFWAQTEVRPDVRVTGGSRFVLVARPRLLASTRSAWSADTPRLDTRDTSANWTELYAHWRMTDSVQVTYGLQNFQWGPAELLSPSNRLFHEVGVFRDPAYYVRGRHLARLNVSAGKEWSIVTLAELGHNGEDAFNSGEPFKRQGQTKVEYASPDGRGYVGATVGVRDGSRAWFGEYGSWAVTQGLSIYVDASHSRGSRAWYPEAHADGVFFSRRLSDASRWQLLGLMGMRYVFVNGIDWRGEYVHQQAGYSQNDTRLAVQAATASPGPFVFERLTAPGLEVLGRRLVLASLRVPDLPPRDRVSIQGRYLHSLTDHSGVAFATATLETSDALVLFGSALVSRGPVTGEFARLARASAIAGALWTW
ncbi:MAG: porin [Vicinamibacterales bacterium]